MTDIWNNLNVQFAAADKDYKPPKYRACISNNQLAFIYQCVRYFVPLINGGVCKNVPISDISTPLNTKSVHPNIYLYDNLIEEEICKAVRQFVKDIPFDAMVPPLDDISNPPLDNVSTDCQDKSKVLEAYALDYTAKPSEWKWENYNHGILRALPLTLQDFIHSPIMILFDILHLKFSKTQFDNLDTTKLVQSVWVIQRTMKYTYIGDHMDDDGYRKISFCYYLTSDSWTAKDGGILLLKNYHTKRFILAKNPVFNSMIVWTMHDCLGPLHCVTPVLSDNVSPRIALVGFYCQVK